MDIQRSDEAGFERAPAERFTGEVWVKYGPAAPDGSSNVVVVNFAPGARTNWHTHAEGQYLYVVEGRGRVCSQGEGGVDARPGDILWVPPGELHFHGAAPDAPFIHFAFNGGGPPDWGNPVSDEEYDTGF